MSTDLTQLPEFLAYQRTRDAVVRLTSGTAADARTGVTSPSEYWTGELENIDYLIDATPRIVRKLRHHSYHVTGIRPYDYKVKADGRRENFEQRLRALQAIAGERLLVPESPEMGGFGFTIDGRLFNVDTLKFYEVFAGMHRGGVLDALRAIDRPVVCEIGAGWGGFAYQFKTLFPVSTYVIVDFAELFLYSATYLTAHFPQARVAFVGDDAPPRERWHEYDFIFVPHTRAAEVSGGRLDLTVNMVSFQEMTGEQVQAYAGMAAAARCPLLYSLNRERSPYNTELVAVSQALETHYRLTEVPVLETDYTSAMKKPPKGGRAVEKSEFNYRHLVGRLPGADGSPLVSSSGTTGAEAPARPRTVLGMTLYNNAGHLREALDSLLAQTRRDFMLLLLDDASRDGTEAIAREYEARDGRVRYRKHAERQAMVATWHDVASWAARDYPGAEYFAWVSDHDRWHPRWLERLMAELDADPETVLAYPITRRITAESTDILKGPRYFDTSGCATLEARWAHLCASGVGAGDMVYGLMRAAALRAAGTFRTVLRPDRLLIAELTLQGRIRQVPEVLWFRRQSETSSINRQHATLVLPGQEPPGFTAPPWYQHTRVLWQEYLRPGKPSLPVTRGRWARMLFDYQISYGWRHLRKTETSHTIATAISRVEMTKKRIKHHYHHAVYATLVTARAWAGRGRRLGRRSVYHVLVLMHRIGLRGGRNETPSS